MTLSFNHPTNRPPIQCAIRKQIKDKKMAKASINIQTATAHTSEHMARESKVNYLIIHDKSVNEYKRYVKDEKAFLKKAEAVVKEKTKRSMQQKAKDTFFHEAVVNLNSGHTLEDVENLFKKLKKEFGGFELVEVAVHRDEGVFIQTNYDLDDIGHDSKTLKWYQKSTNKDITDEVISYAPNRDLFYNHDDKDWYSDRKFENKIDTSYLNKFMNYHAHVKFTKLDMNTGKTVRLGKKELKKIQDITAQELNMERGKPGAVRMTHWQKKEIYHKVNEKKADILKSRIKINQQSNLINKLELKIKDTNKIKQAELDRLKKELEQMIKQSELSNEEKRELHRKNRELNKLLKQKNRNKELSIESLEEQVRNLENEIYLENQFAFEDNDIPPVEYMLTQASKKINMIEKQKKELNVKLEKREEDIKELKRKNKELESQNQNHISEKKELDEIIVEYEPTNTTRAVTWFKNHLKLFAKSIANLTSQIDNYKKEITSLEKENNELKRKLVKEIKSPIKNNSLNL
jgi:hypothetical protein